MAAPNEAGYNALSSANVQQQIQNGDFQGAIQTARSELNDKIKGKTDSLVSAHQGLADAIKQSSPPPASSGPANNSGGSGNKTSSN